MTSLAVARPVDFGSWPHFGADEIEAVQAVLRGGRVDGWSGEQGRAFERAFAEACGRRFALALSSGTLALELALRAQGIGAGDEVVVTPRGSLASAGAVVRLGARPVFADVDRDSGNLTAESVAAVLGPRTRAVIPVHLGGWPCAMDAIMELAARRDLAVIEDAAQAHGATWRGRPVGSFGDLACFSFSRDKIMATGGEGGMLLLDDEARFCAAWAAREQGRGYAAVHERRHPPGFRWQQEGFGGNGRMSEMQAAIGRVQLRKLHAWVAARRRNAALLTRRLAGLPALRLPQPAAHVGHAYHRLYAYLRLERLREGWGRDRVVAEIAAAGVPCSGGACPEIYRERAFVAAGLAPPAALPVARELGATSLMLLVHPMLGEAALHHAADVVATVLARATG